MDSWNGPYVKGGSVPPDPWGNAYVYRSPGQHGNFDIVSLGADGRDGGEGSNADVTSGRADRDPSGQQAVVTGERSAGRRSGFLLLDMALALAIVLLAAAIIWPAIPRGTSSAGLAATVMDVATMLRADRTGAVRDGQRVGTVIDLDGRTVSDARGRTVKVPRDLTFEVTTATPCSLGDRRYQITFNPDGSSSVVSSGSPRADGVFGSASTG